MLRLFVFVCAISALTADIAYGQSARVRSAAQIADSVEIARLARTLTGDAGTDSARVARLYEWVARNLSYDVDGFLHGRLADGGAENVYRKRVAVCGGYVALFERLAREIGLDVMPILGYAKGFTYREGASTRKANHSWVAARIDGNWRLLDPTWASGFVVNRTFEPRFTWDYFLIDPNALVLSHFPEESEWQLLAQPMRRSDFERLPMVPRTLVNAGFDAASIRNTALAQRLRDFPFVSSRRDVRIVNAPLNGTLRRKTTVTVEIIWPGAADVALVSGGVWRHLARDGDRFRGEAIATESSVALVGRAGANKEFETLLHYQVQ